MQRINRVMVVINQHQKQHPTLQRVKQLAKDGPLEVLLFSVLHYPMIEATHILNEAQLQEVQHAMLKHQHSRLEELLQDLEGEPVRCQLQVEWQSPTYISVIRAAEAFHADLVMVSKLQDDAESADVVQLMKACPIPLLLVGQSPPNEDGSVVAAVDPGHKLNLSSKLDDRVLSAAFRLSNQLDLDLHASHCFDPSYWEVMLEAVKSAQIWTDVFPAQANTEPKKVIELLKEHHHKAFVQQCSEWVPASTHQHMLEGEVQASLPALLTSLKASVLVLGTTYRTGLLGSTAEKLLAKVECDVLAIKPLGFESPV